MPQAKMVPVVAFALALMMSSCAGRRYIDVDAEQFAAVYKMPITMSLQTKYKVSDDYCMIDFYDWGTRDWPRYAGTLRARKCDLGKGFPDEARVVYHGSMSTQQKQHEADALEAAARTGVLEKAHMFGL